MTVSIRRAASFAAVLVLVLGIGCGQPPEEVADVQPDTLSAKLPGATPSEGRIVSSELPANFPADVPQYPDAQVLETRATADMGLAITMIIKDDPAARVIMCSAMIQRGLWERASKLVRRDISSSRLTGPGH